MEHRPGYARTWLASERLGDDAAADEALARLFTTLPAIRPSQAFVQRTVQAARRERARRRLLLPLSVAASLVAALGTGSMAYALSGATYGWPLTTLATMLSASSLSLVMAIATSVECWAAMTHASGVITGVVVLPQSGAVLLALTLTGAAALYPFFRLLRSDGGCGSEYHNPGSLCL